MRKPSNDGAKMGAASAVPSQAESVPANVVDSGVGRIRPRARLLRTIGAELISSEIVAILELVRNCFDADASKVWISFQSPERPDETELTIRDNGHGMTRQVLLGPWLEPATDYKSGRKDGLGGERSPKGRRRLGSKGVGRFAAQRLGKHLEVVTRATNQPNELRALFDWERLDRADKYIDELTIPWTEEVSETGVWAGTALQIRQLHDRWDLDRFEKLKLALSRLVGPGLEEDEFRIELSINGSAEEIQPAMDAITAMYSVAGRVDGDGVAHMEYTDAHGSREEWERRVHWPEHGDTCGPFEFRINAWDLDREALGSFLEATESRLGLRDFRRLVRDHAGVSLYRDGFRILPYGEPGNDWLQLDRRRVNNPTVRLSTNQTLGWLKLSADTNPLLKDQTNREGLVTNEAYGHLRAVVRDLLSYLEARRFKARRAAGFGPKRDIRALPAVNEGISSHVEAALSKLEAHDGDASGAMGELREAIVAQQEAASDAIRQYAGLAASGQLAGLVFAQVLHPLRQMETELVNIRNELQSYGEVQPLVGDLGASLNKIELLISEVRARAQKADPLASVRTGRRSLRFDLGKLVYEVMGVFSPQFAQHNIVPEYDPSEVSAIADPTVVGQVLAILVDNAVYWLSRSDDSPRLLRITCAANKLVVSNNGPAIDESIVDQIFEAHFTTRPDQPGLGLTLARDLAHSVGARLRLAGTARPVRFELTF